jgi:mannose-1-phosphate guanylyltransferase
MSLRHNTLWNLAGSGLAALTAAAKHGRGAIVLVLPADQLITDTSPCVERFFKT